MKLPFSLLSLVCTLADDNPTRHRLFEAPVSKFTAFGYHPFCKALGCDVGDVINSNAYGCGHCRWGSPSTSKIMKAIKSQDPKATKVMSDVSFTTEVHTGSVVGAVSSHKTVKLDINQCDFDGPNQETTFDHWFVTAIDMPKTGGAVQVPIVKIKTGDAFATQTSAEVDMAAISQMKKSKPVLGFGTIVVAIRTSVKRKPGDVYRQTRELSKKDVGVTVGAVFDSVANTSYNALELDTSNEDSISKQAKNIIKDAKWVVTCPSKTASAKNSILNEPAFVEARGIVKRWTEIATKRKLPHEKIESAVIDWLQTSLNEVSEEIADEDLVDADEARAINAASKSKKPLLIQGGAFSEQCADALLEFFNAFSESIGSADTHEKSSKQDKGYVLRQL